MEDNFKSKRRKILILLLLGFVVAVGLFAFLFRRKDNVPDNHDDISHGNEQINLNDYHFITLEINEPVIRIYYDDDFSTVGHIFVNTEAEKAFGTLALDKNNLHNVIFKLIDSSFADGYLDDTYYTTTITADYYSQSLISYVQDTIEEYLRKIYKEKDAEIIFLYKDNTNVDVKEVYKTSDYKEDVKTVVNNIPKGDTVVFYSIPIGDGGGSSGKTISNGVIENIPQGVDGLTYNETEQLLFTLDDVSSSTGTVYYALSYDSDTCPALDTFTDTLDPKGTDAGDYYIWYYSKSSDPSKYKDTSPVSVKVTIAQASTSVTTAPSAASSLSYDKSEKELVSAGIASKGGEIQYKLGADGEYSTSIPKAVDAGEYTVYYKSVGSKPNYSDSDENSIVVTINKAKCTMSAPSAVSSLIYNATEQTLISAGNVTGDFEGTVYYAIADTETQPSDSEFTFTNDTLPTRTNASTYYIYYYCVASDQNNVDNSEYGHISNVISKKAIKLTPKNVEMVYGGTPEYAGYDIDPSDGVCTGDTLDGTLAYAVYADTVDKTSDISTLDVNSYILKISGLSNDNYEITYADGTFTITKADGVANAPTLTTELLIDDDTDQKLLSAAGSSDTGTMMYKASTDGTTAPDTSSGFTDDYTAVCGNDYGDYYVWYYSKGDNNHFDTDVTCVEGKVTIYQDYARTGTPKFVTNLLDAKTSLIDSITLPSGYEKIEYLKFDQEQYIMTDVVPKVNTKLIIDFYAERSNNTQYLFSRSINNTYRIGVPRSSTNTSYIISASGGETQCQGSVHPFTNGRHVLLFNPQLNNGYKFSVISRGLEGNTDNWTFNYGLNYITNNSYNDVLVIGNKKSPDISYLFGGKIYSLQIYDVDILTNYFVPVKNDEGKYGLYDLVNEKFFGSESGTDFVAENQGKVIPTDTVLYYVTASDGTAPTGEESTGWDADLNTLITASGTYDIYYRVAAHDDYFADSIIGKFDDVHIAKTTLHYPDSSCTIFVPTLDIDVALPSDDEAMEAMFDDLSAPTGFKFSGWFDSETYENEVTAIKRDIHSDIDLYARYIELARTGTPKLASTLSSANTNLIMSTSLPQEYEELEYLNFTGNQYIELDFVPTALTKTVIDFASNDSTITGENFIFSASTGSAGYSLKEILYDSKPSLSIGETNTQSALATPTSEKAKYFRGNRYQVLYNTYVISDPTTITILNNIDNNETYLWSRILVKNDYSKFVFGACNKGGNGLINFGNYRLYSCQIYDRKDAISQDDTISFNFIPVRRRSDSKYGLYDLVNNKFYCSNDIDHDFDASKQPNAIPKEYEEIEYLQFDGEQYIDLGAIASDYAHLPFSSNLAFDADKMIFNVDYYDERSAERFNMITSGFLMARVSPESIKALSWGLGTSSTSIDGSYTNGKHMFVLDFYPHKVTSGSIPFATFISGFDDRADDSKYTSASSYAFSSFSHKQYIGSNKYNASANSREQSKFKFYSFSLSFEENKLSYCFIPVKRLSDNKYGVYDVINDKFYGCSSDTDFVAEHQGKSVATDTVQYYVTTSDGTAPTGEETSGWDSNLNNLITAGGIYDIYYRVPSFGDYGDSDIGKYNDVPFAKVTLDTYDYADDKAKVGQATRTLIVPTLNNVMLASEDDLNNMGMLSGDGSYGLCYWSTSSSLTDSEDNSIAYIKGGTTADTTIYAVWKKKTVTYDPHYAATFSEAMNGIMDLSVSNNTHTYEQIEYINFDDEEGITLPTVFNRDTEIELIFEADYFSDFGYNSILYCKNIVHSLFSFYRTTTLKFNATYAASRDSGIVIDNFSFIPGRYLVKYNKPVDNSNKKMAFISGLNLDNESSSTYTPNSNLFVDSANIMLGNGKTSPTSQQHHTKMKLCSLRVIDKDNSLIADYVPVQKVGGNETGLYDLISDTFYTDDNNVWVTKADSQGRRNSVDAIQKYYVTAQSDNNYNNGYIPNGNESSGWAEDISDFITKADVYKVFVKRFAKDGSDYADSNVVNNVNNVYSYDLSVANVKFHFHIDGVEDLDVLMPNNNAVHMPDEVELAKMGIYNPGYELLGFYDKETGGNKVESINKESKTIELHARWKERVAVGYQQTSLNLINYVDSVADTDFGAILSIPDEYEGIEYIKMSDNAYFELDYVPTKDTKVTLDAELSSIESKKILFGMRDSARPLFMFSISNSKTSNKNITFSDGSETTKYYENKLNTIDPGCRYLITYNDKKSDGYYTSIRSLVTDELIFDYKSSGVTVPDVNVPLSIGCLNYTNVGFGDSKGSKIFSCQVYENGDIVASLVPVKRKSDNVYGLYDYITDTFLENKGSVAFDSNSQGKVVSDDVYYHLTVSDDVSLDEISHENKWESIYQTSSLLNNNNNFNQYWIAKGNDSYSNSVLNKRNYPYCFVELKLVSVPFSIDGLHAPTCFNLHLPNEKDLITAFTEYSTSLKGENLEYMKTHHIVGWYDSETGGNKVDYIPAGSTGTITLYARWEDNPVATPQLSHSLGDVMNDGLFDNYDLPEGFEQVEYVYLNNDRSVHSIMAGPYNYSSNMISINDVSVYIDFSTSSDDFSDTKQYNPLFANNVSEQRTFGSSVVLNLDKNGGSVIIGKPYSKSTTATNLDVPEQYGYTHGRHIVRYNIPGSNNTKTQLQLFGLNGNTDKWTYEYDKLSYTGYQLCIGYTFIGDSSEKNTFLAKMRVYSFRTYDNNSGRLIQNFVPVRKKGSSGESMYYIYDTVNDMMTNEFTSGGGEAVSFDDVKIYSVNSTTDSRPVAPKADADGWVSLNSFTKDNNNFNVSSDSSNYNYYYFKSFGETESPIYCLNDYFYNSKDLDICSASVNFNEDLTSKGQIDFKFFSTDYDFPYPDDSDAANVGAIHLDAKLVGWSSEGFDKTDNNSKGYPKNVATSYNTMYALYKERAKVPFSILRDNCGTNDFSNTGNPYLSLGANINSGIEYLHFDGNQYTHFQNAVNTLGSNSKVIVDFASDMDLFKDENMADAIFSSNLDGDLDFSFVAKKNSCLIGFGDKQYEFTKDDGYEYTYGRHILTFNEVKDDGKHYVTMRGINGNKDYWSFTADFGNIQNINKIYYGIASNYRGHNRLYSVYFAEEQFESHCIVWRPSLEYNNEYCLRPTTGGGVGSSEDKPFDVNTQGKPTDYTKVSVIYSGASPGSIYNNIYYNKSYYKSIVNEATSSNNYGRLVVIYRVFGYDDYADSFAYTTEEFTGSIVTLHSNVSDSQSDATMKFQICTKYDVKLPTKYNIHSSLARPNSTFVGIYDAKTGGNKVEKIDAGTTSSLDLYVRWQDNTSLPSPKFDINIEYDLDGSVNNPDNPLVYDTLSDEFVLLDPTKEGYEFIGWFDEDGNQITSLNNSINDDIVLYAKFTKLDDDEKSLPETDELE